MRALPLTTLFLACSLPLPSLLGSRSDLFWAFRHLNLGLCGLPPNARFRGLWFAIVRLRPPLLGFGCFPVYSLAWWVATHSSFSVCSISLAVVGRFRFRFIRVWGFAIWLSGLLLITLLGFKGFPLPTFVGLGLDVFHPSQFGFTACTAPLLWALGFANPLLLLSFSSFVAFRNSVCINGFHSLRFQKNGVQLSTSDFLVLSPSQCENCLFQRARDGGTTRHGTRTSRGLPPPTPGTLSSGGSRPRKKRIGGARCAASAFRRVSWLGLPTAG